MLTVAVVALALVAQATDFKGPFVAITIVLLSVVIGAATGIRVGQPAGRGADLDRPDESHSHSVVGLEPRMARHLVTSPHDAELGMLISAGPPPGFRKSRTGRR